MKTIFKIPLTIVMIEDARIGGFTAFFKQFPDIVAEGDTDEKAMKNLMNTVYDVFVYKNSVKSNQLSLSKNIIEKQIDFYLNVDI